MRIFPESTTTNLRAMAMNPQWLAEGTWHSIENQNSTAHLPVYTQEFEFIFTKDSFDILLEHHHWDHTIELTLGSKSKLSKMYPLSLIKQTKLDIFLEENLCTGHICPSKSSIAIPVFFIKKKNSSLWLVQDYHALNSITVKNQYLLSYL